MKIRKGVVAAACAMAAAFASAEVPRPVNKRAIVMGDSITHGGYCLYYLQLMENLRHPGSTTRYYNAGRNSYTLEGGIAICAKEVSRIRPDCAFVMFGMNDIQTGGYPTEKAMTPALHDWAMGKIATFRALYPELLYALETNGVSDVTLVTPSPYDEYSSAATSEARYYANELGLTEASKAVREIASGRKLPFVELHEPMTAIVKEHPEMLWCGNDRTHPLRLGHLYMAAQYWQAFGETNPVAAVALTSAGEKTSVENATVSNVKATADGLSFDYAPNALPLPDFQEYASLKAAYGEIEKFNRETLTVTGLEKGLWRLRSDGRVIGTFSDEEFSAGVNLAELNTTNRWIAAGAGVAMLQLHDLDKRILDKIRSGGAATEEELAEQERLYQAMAAVRPAASRLEIGLMPATAWFDANVESYAAWPDDAASAFGGRWNSASGISTAAGVPSPGNLKIETFEPLCFTADERKGLAGATKTVTITTQAEMGCHEVMPDIGEGCKAGVAVGDQSGVKSYYGIIGGQWKKLDGASPSGGVVPVSISFAKSGGVQYVSYAIDGKTCSIDGQTKFALAMDAVSQVGFRGTGTVRSLVGNAESCEGTVMFLR